MDHMLTGTLTLFQAAREPVAEWQCHMQRPGIKPVWLNLEARNLPLDQNTPLITTCHTLHLSMKVSQNSEVAGASTYPEMW